MHYLKEDWSRTRLGTQRNPKLEQLPKEPTHHSHTFKCSNPQKLLRNSRLVSAIRGGDPKPSSGGSISQLQEKAPLTTLGSHQLAWLFPAGMLSMCGSTTEQWGRNSTAFARTHHEGNNTIMNIYYSSCDYVPFGHKCPWRQHSFIMVNCIFYSVVCFVIHGIGS